MGLVIRGSRGGKMRRARKLGKGNGWGEVRKKGGGGWFKIFFVS